METNASTLGTSSNTEEKTTYSSLDKIGELPDDVLVAILCQLTFKEAVVTSVLSHRWKNLWRFVPKSIRLEFDGTKVLEDLLFKMQCGIRPIDTNSEISQFITSVDQSLILHQGWTVEEFLVRFLICHKFSSRVDDWIHFAMKQNVQRLVLEFGEYGGYMDTENYKFPLWAVDNLVFNSLTDLQLSFIDVTEEVLEKLLYNCKGLERLSVKCSYTVVNLKLSGISLKLKVLEFISCANIKSIDICAPNLESFIFYGPILTMPFKGFPALNEAAFGGAFMKFVIQHFNEFSSYLSRLEKLSLEVSLLNPRELLDFPVLGNVKHLELILFASQSGSLLRFRPMIEACPLLHKFVLKISWLNSYLELDRPLLEIPKCPHPCLKEVELIGFMGCSKDRELVHYFLKNAVSLSKIIFDPRRPSTLTKSWAFDSIKNLEAVRSCARQLGANFPSTVEIVIL